MKTTSRILSALLLSSLGACAVQAGDGDLETYEDGTGTGESEDGIIARGDVTLFTENGNEVPVCFLTPGLSAERERVRTAINESWGRVSALRFTGFGTCSATIPSRTVPIEFEETDGAWGGYAQYGMGSRLKDSSAQILLRLTPNRYRLEATAIHEMGHVLGLAHEQSHPQSVRCAEAAFRGNCKTDADCRTATSTSCTQDNQCPAGQGCVNSRCTIGAEFMCDTAATSGDAAKPYRCVHNQSLTITDGQIETPYDPESIMNYCRDDNGSTLAEDALSPWDIVGIQRLYGMKPLNSIVGTQNRCIEIDNPGLTTPTVPTELQVSSCVGNSNQRWAWRKTGSFEAYKFGSGAHKFMDVKWGAEKDGTPIWNWTYNGDTAQIWRLHEVAIVGEGGLCLEVAGDVKLGAGVRVATCNRSTGQRWTVGWVGVTENGVTTYYNQLRAGPSLSFFCLQASGTSGLSLAMCNSSASSQHFTLARRQIKARAGNCFDVKYAEAKSGQGVQRYGCRVVPTTDEAPTDKAAWAQMWFVRGHIKNEDGKCAMVRANSPVVDGSPMILWGCGDYVPQTWDYHF